MDGLSIEQTAQLLRQSWPDIRQTLLAGSYRPSPVRKVLIPKPDGSQRELGIPTVIDRLIQQAMLQVLQPLMALQVAGNSRRLWRNSDRLLKTVLTIAYFDRLGVPRLS